MAFEGINDKLQALGVYTLNAFLYNMVSILVLDTFQHMAVQFLNDVHLMRGIRLKFVMFTPIPNLIEGIGLKRSWSHQYQTMST